MANEPGVFLPLSKKISQDITVDSTKKIQFRDTGIYLQSSADGKLLISSDGSGSDDVTINGSLTLTGDFAPTGATTFTGEVTITGTAIPTNVSASNDVIAADRLTGGGLFLVKESFTAAGTASADVGYIHIAPATAATISVNITAPQEGQFLVASMPGAGTANLITLAGTFDGTNDVGAFTAAGQALVLFGISTTRFVIVENIGTVTFS